MTTMQLYRRSKNGLLRNMYCGIKQRSKETGKELSFTSDEFYAWCLLEKSFHSLYRKWVKSGYLRSYKPSIDRIDPFVGYHFYNIQVVTYDFNIQKGRIEQELLIGIPIIQCHLNGAPIKTFKSSSGAARELGISQGNISSVLNGKRNHTKGFVFKFANLQPV